MQSLLSFDKRYLLIVIPVLRYVMPWLEYRCRMIYAVFFVGLWVATMVMSGHRPLIRARGMLRWGIVVLLMLYLYHGLPNLYGIFGYGMAREGILAKSKMLISDYLAFVIMYVSVRYGKFKEIKLMTLGLMVGMTLTGFNAFRQGDVMMDIGSGRAMVYWEHVKAGIWEMSYDLEETLEAVESGLVNYRGAYICACAVPLFFYSFFKMKLMAMKTFAVIAALGCLFSIRSAGLGTPVLTVSSGVAVAFCALIVKRFNAAYWVTFIMVVGIVSFAYNPSLFSFVSTPVRAIADSVEASQFKQRLHAVADVLDSSNKSSYAYTRYGRQRESIQSFLHRPILGYVDHKRDIFAFHGGGHSELLDKLAYHGMLGGFVYFFLMFAFSRYAYYSSRCLGLHNEPFRLSRVLIGTLVISSIANPIPILPGLWYILAVGLCMFFKDSQYCETRRDIFVSPDGHGDDIHGYFGHR